MPSAKISLNKNRKVKIFFCYIGLVVLIVLLFLPAAFRIFIKEKENVEKKVVTVLSCQKLNESVSSTFLNDKPQNILYTIKGDYRVTANPDEYNVPDDETDEKTEIKTENNIKVDNQFISKIREFSEITYDGEKDVTSFRTSAEKLNNSTDFMTIFNTVNNQETYYRSLGFTCTKTNV